MDGNDISPRMRKLLTKGRAEARRRVIDRGLVQFRADSDTMEKLLEVSEHRGIPLGTMVREWIKERLKNQEQSSEQSAAQYRELRSQIQDLKKTVVNLLRAV
jgi:hypothetical protein